MGIQIKYTGSSGVRILEQYEWNSDNGYVVEVDVDTAANLITYPIPGQFALIADQKISAADRKKLEDLIGAKLSELTTEAAVVDLPPTLSDVTGLSEERIASLARAGVESLEALAGLDEAAVKAVASKTGATRSEISGWSEQAAGLLPAK